MKIAFLYVLFVIGIPNFLGLICGFPLAIFVPPISRWIGSMRSTPDVVRAGAQMIVMGICEGTGCGVAGILLALLFGYEQASAIPLLATISSVWALIAFYARSLRLQAWTNAIVISTAWAAYFIWRTRNH